MNNLLLQVIDSWMINNNTGRSRMVMLFVSLFILCNAFMGNNVYFNTTA